MRILCLNAGSSSLKWSVIEMPGEAQAPAEVGSLGSSDIGQILVSGGAVEAVAHRLVHGGDRYRSATLIDDRMHEALATLVDLDPVHLPAALAGIDAARRRFPNVPQIACFDTAFHASLPPAAYTYAIPRSWTEEWGLRRFGFHGLSVAYAVRRTGEILGALPEHLLVCHLGSGSSITAVRAGRSLDTTMGFTPLEGLPMATRSGSVDPGALLYLLRARGLDASEVEGALEQQSGLRGLFGGSGDLREVLAAVEQANARAVLAYGVLITGFRRGFGAMLASLGGLDAVVFTGGIGENAPRVRSDLLSTFGWAGLALDTERNARPEGDARLSPEGSRVAVLRIRAREDLSMASEAFDLLRDRG